MQLYQGITMKIEMPENIQIIISSDTACGNKSLHVKQAVFVIYQNFIVKRIN